MKKLLAIILVLAFCSANATERSAKQRSAFARANHCPVTHKPRGACPGYVVDHIKPLACGGADHPSNMQWQTVAEAKAKDKWERKGCRYKPYKPQTP